MEKVKVIAEIGENHIGDIAIAKKLIRQAARAGADYVKFQSYTPATFRRDDPEYAWFKKVSLSDEDHFRLKEYARDYGVKFLSSPFSKERAEFLCQKLGLRAIKIASGVMCNFGLLDYVNEHADTVFLSTGLSTISEIRKSLRHLKKIKNCYILHCVTQYPCKDKEVNLLAIRTLKKEFPAYAIGYSDHTVGIDACLAAVALSAMVIEKHFTFDKNYHEGSDHLISATAEDLKEMVVKIRRIELLLGDGKKTPSEGEKEILSFVRNRFKEQ